MDKATAYPFLSVTQSRPVSVTTRHHPGDDTGLKRRLGLESHIPWMIIDDFRNGARAKEIICGHEFAAVYILFYVTCSFFTQVRAHGLGNPFMGEADASCFGRLQQTAHHVVQ